MVHQPLGTPLGSHLVKFQVDEGAEDHVSIGGKLGASTGYLFQLTASKTFETRCTPGRKAGATLAIFLDMP